MREGAYTHIYDVTKKQTGGKTRFLEAYKARLDVWKAVKHWVIEGRALSRGVYRVGVSCWRKRLLALVYEPSADRGEL